MEARLDDMETRVDRIQEESFEKISAIEVSIGELKSRFGSSGNQGASIVDDPDLEKQHSFDFKSAVNSEIRKVTSQIEAPLVQLLDPPDLKPGKVLQTSMASISFLFYASMNQIKDSKGTKNLDPPDLFMLRKGLIEIYSLVLSSDDLFAALPLPPWPPPRPPSWLLHRVHHYCHAHVDNMSLNVYCWWWFLSLRLAHVFRPFENHPTEITSSSLLGVLFCIPLVSNTIPHTLVTLIFGPHFKTCDFCNWFRHMGSYPGTLVLYGVFTLLSVLIFRVTFHDLTIRCKLGNNNPSLVIGDCILMKSSLSFTPWMDPFLVAIRLGFFAPIFSLALIKDIGGVEYVQFVFHRTGLALLLVDLEVVHADKRHGYWGVTCPIQTFDFLVVMRLTSFGVSSLFNLWSSESGFLFLGLG
ncbi:hypothetical protein Syun_018059 [Stephania yunnanensis]|uniref:Uncharacterized protein n=1 Tax=Stephania yunnanensis TaxID=152371 RepID=A0AAP0NUN5_9MAGN